MKELVIYNENPPKLESSNLFRDCHSEFLVKVPASAVDKYKVASYWSSIASKIVALETE